MPAFTRVQVYVRDRDKGVHQLHAAGHVLKVALTNIAPQPTYSLFSQITEITAEHGYVAGGVDIDNDIVYLLGTSDLTVVNKTITASGGSFGPWRYAVIYNDTPTSPLDPIIGYADYGSNITVASGESVLVSFGAYLLRSTT